MKSISVFILSILFLTSCQIRQEPPGYIQTNVGKQLMFFSDKRNLDKEGNYYDALLEIKQSYPSEVANMKVIPFGENERNMNVKVSTYPSLLVLNDNKVIEQIEGEVGIEQIIEPIEAALK